jgi:uncharacterized protein
MKKIELEIIALSHSITQSHSYAVVLGESGGTRRLPIVIGGFEAQAIAVALEKMFPSRPLTHDLMKNMLDQFEITLQEVIINNLSEGIFYAQLVCRHGNDVLEIDSRTSDAIALAVRFDCPIYTYEFILETAGIHLEDSAEEALIDPLKKIAKKETNETPDDLSKQTLHELNDLMQKYIEQEDYEKAISIRDEISRRKKSS